MKCCKQCGRVGITGENCPPHPCNYCERGGHVASSRRKPEGRRCEKPQSRDGSSLPPEKRHKFNQPLSLPNRNSSSPNTESPLDPQRSAGRELRRVNIELAMWNFNYEMKHTHHLSGHLRIIWYRFGSRKCARSFLSGSNSSLKCTVQAESLRTLCRQSI